MHDCGPPRCVLLAIQHTRECLRRVRTSMCIAGPDGVLALRKRYAIDISLNQRLHVRILCTAASRVLKFLTGADASHGCYVGFGAESADGQLRKRVSGG